jgi:hypothetical protein
MSHLHSHWGLTDETGAEGSYEQQIKRPERAEAAVVLTEAGEVLIHRERPTERCNVALMIGRNASALTRPQTERMLRTWDIALAVANGNSDAVVLQPMPHHWRFSRVDYMTWDEWLSTRAPGETTGVSSRDDRDARR